MSKSRRNFSAEFKAKLVIEALEGEKPLNQIATENGIQPNLLRNWKRSSSKTPPPSLMTRRRKTSGKAHGGAKREAAYAKKVGQLTMQVDWLKKNLKKLSDLTTRVNLVRNLLTTKEIPVSQGADLLDINRTSVYYESTPVSDEELECKRIIDRLHTDNPAWGARQMSSQLKRVATM